MKRRHKIEVLPVRVDRSRRRPRGAIESDDQGRCSAVGKEADRRADRSRAADHPAGEMTTIRLPERYRDRAQPVTALDVKVARLLDQLGYQQRRIATLLDVSIGHVSKMVGDHPRFAVVPRKDILAQGVLDQLRIDVGRVVPSVKTAMETRPGGPDWPKPTGGQKRKKF